MSDLQKNIAFLLKSNELDLKEMHGDDLPQQRQPSLCLLSRTLYLTRRLTHFLKTHAGGRLKGGGCLKGRQPSLCLLSRTLYLTRRLTHFLKTHAGGRL